jgi:hypothetical protein
MRGGLMKSEKKQLLSGHFQNPPGLGDPAAF